MRFPAILLAIPLLSVVLRAEDYETPGARAALERQLEAVSPDKPLHGWYTLQPRSRPKWFQTEEQIKDPFDRAALVQQLNRKLDSITVPQIELKNTPLKAALIWLAAESKKSDPNTNDPAKGIDISICFSKPEPESLARVNLSLRNATVREALVKVIASNNLRMAVKPWGVVVRD